MKPPSREHLVHLSDDEPNRMKITTRAMMPWKDKYSIKARSLSLIWDSDSEAIFSGFALGLFLFRVQWGRLSFDDEYRPERFVLGSSGRYLNC